MTEAKILLRNPSLSIQQIADQLNFSDQSSFGKFFKKHHRMSPLEYRKTKGEKRRKNEQ
jgi:AraC-like DNA-binding protein